MARIRTDFPRTPRVVDHVFIPLADGTRLAARIWLPDDAEADPVPAVLEYLPYRLNDGTASGDHQQMGWFAGHGYAGVRVDMRGNGESDGVYLDEYAPQEQEDALEVIAWLAAQPWCTGAVGMMRLLLERLQRACRSRRAGRRRSRRSSRFFASDDRYADDVHYRGGLVCPWTCCTGRPACSPSTPSRPTPRWSATTGASAGCARLDGDAALHRGLAVAPAPRRLLAAGLGADDYAPSSAR